jgi:hypothetical protein
VADFKRATSGDILLEGGDLVWITGAAAIQQDIEFRLNVGLGECVYDVNAGTPWIQIIFLDETTAEARRFILRSIVRNTPGVIDCEELTYSLDPQTRIATVTGRAHTIAGDVTFNVDGSAKDAA